MNSRKSSRIVDPLHVYAGLTFLGVLGFVVAFGCAGGFKPIARTVVDIAIASCESIAQQDSGNLGGMTPSDWCAIATNVQPFIDGLLSAQQKSGLRPPVYK